MTSANIWFRFVLAVLAAWRVTHLLAEEDGPADAIVRVRVWLGERWVGKLMDCFNCLSLWIAAPVALFVSRKPLEWFVTWLALAGGACLLERLRQDPVVLEPVSKLEEGESDHVLWKQTHDHANGDAGDAGHFQPSDAIGNEERVCAANRGSLHGELRAQS